MAIDKKREARLKEICAAINKAEKADDVVTYLGSEETIRLERFSSGCAGFDLALGGGWPRGRFIEVFGPESSGKCHAKGTLVLMYDGSLKKVEDIVVGDKVMGADSSPRKVEALARGRGKMYKVCVNKGLDESFIVNDEHILSLKNTEIGRKFGEITNISVSDFMKKSKNFRYYHKLYRVPVEFEASEPLPVEPYFLGLWLGDGCSDSIRIYTMDAEVVRYLDEFASRIGMSISIVSKDKCPGYSIVGGKGQYQSSFSLQHEMKKLGVLLNKHIPHAYKTASRQDRLELLAGLLDSDGYKSNCSIIFSNINEKLVDDVVFLARSLGFFCNKKKYTAKCQTGASTQAFKVYINGDCSTIPLKLARKKPSVRVSKRDPLVSSFDVEDAGIDDFYGFVLDGDHRYLLDSFIVNHNTTVCLHAIAEFQKAYPGEEVGLVDTEYSFDEDYARSLNVDTDVLIVNQPNSGEQGLKVVRHLIKHNVGLIIVDSVAALVPEAELAGDIGDSHVGQHARLMTQTMRILTSEAGQRNCTVFWTNQMRDKIGVTWGDKTTQTGGHALRHHSSIRVGLATISKEKDGDEIVGVKVQASVKKNKCISSGEVLFVPTEGKCYYVDELVGMHSFAVTSFDGKKMLLSRATDCIPQSVEPCIEVGVRGVGSLVVNMEHPFLTPVGYVKAEDLRPRDLVAAVTTLPLSRNGSMSLAKARLSGLLCGDGWTGGTTGISLRNFSAGCVSVLKDCCEKFECEAYEKADQPGLWVIRQKGGGHKGKPSTLNDFLRECGLFGKTAIDKEVPSILFSCPSNVVGAFLGCLLATDGYVSQEMSGRHTVGFCTVSKKLAEGIRHLLLKEGICSCVSKRSPRNGGIVEGRQIVGRNTAYEVRIRRTDDVTRLASIVDWSDGKLRPVSVSSSKKRPDVVWRRVKFIKPAGDRMTYDICNTGFENFEIHGMVTHNTAPPFRKAEFYVSFGTGIDSVAEVCDAALVRKVVTKRGATISFGDVIVGKGRKDFLATVKADPELKAKLEEALRTAPPPTESSEDDEKAARGSFKKPKGIGPTKRVPVESEPEVLDSGDGGGAEGGVEAQDA